MGKISRSLLAGAAWFSAGCLFDKEEDSRQLGDFSPRGTGSLWTYAYEYRCAHSSAGQFMRKQRRIRIEAVEPNSSPLRYTFSILDSLVLDSCRAGGKPVACGDSALTRAGIQRLPDTPLVKQTTCRELDEATLTCGRDSLMLAHFFTGRFRPVADTTLYPLAFRGATVPAFDSEDSAVAGDAHLGGYMLLEKTYAQSLGLASLEYRKTGAGGDPVGTSHAFRLLEFQAAK